MKVKRNTLLLLACLVWSAAGFNILRIGLIVYPAYLTVLNFLLSVLVFAVFQKFIFGKLVKKHTARINAYTEDRHFFLKFFDGKAFAIMAVMMTVGIGLRASGLAPERFIAVFYTGLGASLLLAGLLFGRNFGQAVLADARVQNRIEDKGGQDSKVIEVDHGMVVKFEMNDKCAAGTGRFFEVLTNRLMGVEMDELSDMIAAADAPSQISSMCTIFAESEIISHLSEGQKKENIIAGVGWAIARRIVGMGRSGRIPFNSKIVFSGGVANNRSIAGIFEQLLGKPVTPSVNPQSTAALGAAITAVNE